MRQSWVVAIDVGGTFTDAVAIGSEGAMEVAKVPSTPTNPSEAFARSFTELTSAGVGVADVRLVSHGTTVATNALLTGKLGRVALVASEGFRDILGYRDGTRPDIYNLEPARPSELVPRRDRLEVHERISSTGVVVPLTRGEIDRVVREVERHDPEAVAVALLFSYLDDRHERALGEALRSRLRCPVTLSSEVAREFREYPRTATAALNAGLRPVVGRYLLEARGRLDELGVAAQFLVMQSNGGCAPAERADREAHRMILSGPAAGVTGVVGLGAANGLDELISLDMGGTSLDVCLVNGSVPPIVPAQELDGHPILASAVNIETLGAGGGSVIKVDRAGLLQVGPQSAGAEPGPAAYGLGGTDATVTDAHVVAGTLSSNTPLAGRLTLDEDAARAVLGRVARDLDMAPDDATRGVLAVTLAHIVRAMRRVSVERGIDPRGYTMVAYGGAGPMHAGLILRELRLARVVVPPHPGLFSASGLVAADLRIDDSWTILALHDPSRFDDVLAWYRETSRALLGQLREDGIPRSRARLVGAVDCRYLGQGYELTVPLPSLTAVGLRALRRDFDELHRSVYGHANSAEPVELVALRLSGFGAMPRVEAPAIPRGRREPAADARVGRRPVILPTGRRPVRADVYRREGLRAGNRIPGPAIVEQMDSTTLVLGGQVARVDATGNLWIEDGR